MVKKAIQTTVQGMAALFVCVGAFRLAVEDVQLLPEMKTPPRQVATQKSSCLERSLEKVVADVASKNSLDPRLLLAVIHVESGCNVKAVSAKGAVGPMQLLPSTAKGLGFSNPTHPEENIRAGAHYLKSLHEQFGQNTKLALAAYNAGPSAVRRYRGMPPFRETQNYVQKVLRKYTELREV